MEENTNKQFMKFGSVNYDKITLSMELKVVESGLLIDLEMPLYAWDFYELKKVIGDKEILLHGVWDYGQEIYYDKLLDIHFVDDLIPLQEKLEKINSLIVNNTNLCEIYALTDSGIHNIDDIIENMNQKNFYFIEKNQWVEDVYKMLENKNDLIVGLKTLGINVTLNGILLLKKQKYNI